MLNQDVVRRLTIHASETGLTAVNTKLREHEVLQGRVAASATRAATATEAADRRMRAFAAQRDRAMAAFNAGGLGGIGATAGSSAGAFAMRNVAPIVAGVAAVAAAYAALNAVWERGSDLLEKYANGQRRFDRADLAETMKGLTKYQDDTISAEQVQRASELGMRLEDAKFTISQFFKVQLDVTDGALSLQTVWVRVVETIAEGIRKLERFIELTPKTPVTEGQDWMGAAVTWSLNKIGIKPEEVQQQVTQVDALAAAYKNLGAAMGTANIGKEGAPLGGAFGAVWGDYIKQIDEVNKTTKEAATTTEDARAAWDRAQASASKRIAVQAAEAKAVGLGAGAQAKFRIEAELTEAALRSKLDPASADVAATIKVMGERAEESATKLAKLKLQSDIKFETDTLFMSGREQQIAREMKEIYGPQWQSQMGSAQANQRRMNYLLLDAKNVTVEFAQSFVQGMMNGKSATDALIASLATLGSKMMNTGLDNALGGAFGMLKGDPLAPATAALGVAQAAVGWGCTFPQKPQAKSANDNACEAKKKEPDNVRGQHYRAA